MIKQAVGPEITIKSRDGYSEVYIGVEFRGYVEKLGHDKFFWRNKIANIASGPLVSGTASTREEALHMLGVKDLDKAVVK